MKIQIIIELIGQSPIPRTFYIQVCIFGSHKVGVYSDKIVIFFPI